MFVQKKFGFTLIEILITLAVLVVIFASASVYFDTLYSRLYESESLNSTSLMLTSMLQEARSLTVTSKNGIVYGVHIGTSDVTLFQGNVYTAGAPTNDVRSTGVFAQISSVSLNGGGSDVIFQRLTGQTTNYGNIGVWLSRDHTKTKTINITQTGIVSIN